MSVDQARRDYDFVEAAAKIEQERRLKVPGEVPAVGKMSFEIMRLREELKAKSVVQLKEALERQEKLTKNPALLKKLPDKGEKSMKTVEMIKELIKDKEGVESLEERMKAVKIDTDKMEWKGKLLDSDDDSDPEADGPIKDPLALLAQGVVPRLSSKAVSEKENLQEMSSIEAFALKEAEKVDSLIAKQSFVPFKNTKTLSLTEELKKQNPAPSSIKPKESSRQHKTPSIPLPNLYNCETKQLSLTESLKLQQEQDRKLREIQMKHAADKLRWGINVQTQDNDVAKVGAQFEEYRDATTEDVDEVEEDEESGVNIMSVVDD